MAKSKNNGNGALQESLTALNQSMALLNQSMAALHANQIAFTARMAEVDARHAESRREHAELEREIAARFAAIDKRFDRIEAILVEHNRTLQALPDAVREKIGFRMPEQRTEKYVGELYDQKIRHSPHLSPRCRCVAGSPVARRLRANSGGNAAASHGLHLHAVGAARAQSVSRTIRP